ncbi:MAG: ATP-binding protein [Cohaesibacter sp.]|nr:ATP-binding protein [Cohaesibacter sp.]
MIDRIKIKSFRLRLWPRSITGQLMLAIVGAVIIAQAFSIFLFARERLDVTQTVVRKQVLDRTASVVTLLNETDASLHRNILRAAGGTGIHYSLRNKTRLRVPRLGTPAAALANSLQNKADMPAQSVRVRLTNRKFFHRWDKKRDPQIDDPFLDGASSEDFDRRFDEEDRAQRRKSRRERDKDKSWTHDHHGKRFSAWDMAIAVPLDNGRWLHVKTIVPKPPKTWGIAFLISMLVLMLLMFAAVYFSVRKLTSPLRSLERAARKLGRGEAIEPLEEKGPKELVGTISAFNNMQDRLMRFVQDRTRMLAAISHDLRTPITTLRLRAEFIDDDEMREKILATLEEMQAMTEAVLAFAREDASSEETKSVDVSALLASIAEDYCDMGKDVTFEETDSLVYNCRPMSLKRAIRNLIENALRYAGSAQIVLSQTADALVIDILDQGKGIPKEQMEQVFAPFFRVEGSRNLETGGVGLGLSITRTIIRSHGGDVCLSNRREGGLRATITLPK